MISSALLIVVTSQAGAGTFGHAGAWTGHLKIVQHWFVDFLELPLRCFVFHTHNNPIGMEEVADRGALAQEFGVRGDAEFYVRFAAIDGKGALEFLPCLCRHGAFLNDELRRSWLR